MFSNAAERAPALGMVSTNGHQVQNLGLFRLILALFVLYQHNEKFIFHEPSGSILEALEIGSLAVLAFFSLSGYVIIGGVDRFYRARPVAFLVNRFNRILPLYAVVVICSMVVLAPLAFDGRLADGGGELSGAEAISLSNLLANLIWIFPFANKLIKPDFIFVSIAWAVTTELLFYFVIFAVMTIGMWVRRPFSEIATAAALSALAVAAVELGSGVIGFSTAVLAPYFVFGGSLYYFRTKASATVVLCMALSVLLMGWELLSRPELHEAVGFVRNQSGQLMLLATMMVILVAGTYTNPIPTAFDRRAGSYSYPIYIAHILPVLGLISIGAAETPSVGWFILSVVLAVVFAAACEFLVEKPVATLREKVRRVRLN